MRTKSALSGARRADVTGFGVPYRHEVPQRISTFDDWNRPRYPLPSRGGGSRGVRSRRFLGVGSGRRDPMPGCRLRLGAPLLRCGALRAPGFYGKGRHGSGLRWFAAPELTLARPKAPHIARRALSPPVAGQVHRPAPIAMRPLRQKSSRFLSRGALEASQSRGLVSRLTGAMPAY